MSVEFLFSVESFLCIWCPWFVRIRVFFVHNPIVRVKVLSFLCVILSPVCGLVILFLFFCISFVAAKKFCSGVFIMCFLCLLSSGQYGGAQGQYGQQYGGGFEPPPMASTGGASSTSSSGPLQTFGQVFCCANPRFFIGIQARVAHRVSFPSFVIAT